MLFPVSSAPPLVLPCVEPRVVGATVGSFDGTRLGELVTVDAVGATLGDVTGLRVEGFLASPELDGDHVGVFVGAELGTRVVGRSAGPAPTGVGELLTAKAVGCGVGRIIGNVSRDGASVGNSVGANIGDMLIEGDNASDGKSVGTNVGGVL